MSLEFCLWSQPFPAQCRVQVPQCQGRCDQSRALGVPGHAGDPEAFLCPKESTRGAESSNKGLARMRSPGKHFPQEQWETMGLHRAGQHITQKARGDSHALLGPSKNAQNKQGLFPIASEPAASTLIQLGVKKEENESASHLVMSDSLLPLDCSPPVSSVHGILQARILEWVATPSSRRSSGPRERRGDHN